MREIAAAKTAYQLALNGGSYLEGVQPVLKAGSLYHAGTTITVSFNPDGTYAIAGTYDGAAGVSSFSPNPGSITGTWLPAGRSASDFTITISETTTAYQASSNNFSDAYLVGVSWAATSGATKSGGGACNANQAPTLCSLSGSLTSTASGSGAQAVSVQLTEIASHFASQGGPVGPASASGQATVTVTIRDNRSNVNATTSFTIAVRS